MRGVWAPLIKLIVFIVVTVVATSVLALLIANSGAAGKNSYQAIFSDAAMLNPGDDVRIAGVRVGAVQDVEIYDQNLAKVSFNVNRARLPKSTQVSIRYRNLAGLRYVALEKGPSDGEMVGAGYTFPYNADRHKSSTHPAVNLTELFNGFRPLFQQITPEDMNKLAETVINVFQNGDGVDMGATIGSLIQQTAELTNTIADKDAVIGEMITNLTKVLDTVNNNDQQLTQLLNNTEALVTGLAAQRDSVGSAITSVSNLTSLTGSILSQTRPSIQQGLSGLKVTSDKIAAREDDVNKILENLPVKLQKLGRSATFGSWFQFYLCGLDIRAGNGKSPLLSEPLIPLPDINHVLYTSAATRCWADGKINGEG